MRMGIDYFKYLEPKIQREYIFEFNTTKTDTSSFKSIDDIMKHKFNSFNAFVSSSFIWAQTVKGHTYWYSLVDKNSLIIERDLKLKELGI